MVSSLPQNLDSETLHKYFDSNVALTLQLYCDSDVALTLQLYCDSNVATLLDTSIRLEGMLPSLSWTLGTSTPQTCIAS